MANNQASIQFGPLEDAPLINEQDFEVLMIGKNTEHNKKNENGEVLLGIQDLQADVCTEVEFNAKDKDTGEPIKVDWIIQVGNGDAKPLEGIKEIVGKKIVKESYIKFVIPKEWGQKNIVLTARLQTDPKKKASGNIKIRDHIVAAFFRLNNKVAHRKKLLDMDKVKNFEKNYINLFGPVHHHQGMYKVDKTYYISGSTIKNVPTYTYILQEESEDSYSLKDVILFDEGGVNRYRHAGGLQVANGLMAIGIEKYNYGITGFFGSASQDKSVVCFIDEKKKYQNLPIGIVRENKKEYTNASEKYAKIKESKKDKKDIDGGDTASKENADGKKSQEENKLIEGRDFASAAGIVFIEEVDATPTATANNKENSDKPKSNGRYIVVVRGDKQAVRFYEIDGDKKKITPISKNFPEIGEFQNVNLHLNEKGEVYMFGMGNSKMGGVDKCKIYRVDLSPSNVNLLDVWINKQGLIEEKEANKSNKLNELVFECHDGTSFHWASCIQMIASKNRKEETDLEYKDQKAKNGFEGTFAVYTINYEVINYEIDEYALRMAYEDYRMAYEYYVIGEQYDEDYDNESLIYEKKTYTPYQIILDSDAMSHGKPYCRNISEFRELYGYTYSNPVDGYILCNYFKEDIDND